ncbi:myelin-associated glycoprotein-like isoform X2 [Echeneis naucrates]|uniref:myelin-associated glycoprotein-like isoform X2 n=1 Tax=Echeneis naucrates TaxID=173247 RepID=UPI0011142D90|nr:myelin-associated glycoprotein-like isoform X2 [Echeneis naucrates]
MSGCCPILLSFCLIGSIFSMSWAWQVDLPHKIEGLLNSCLVIPCSFDYYQYPPNDPDRVVWYKYVSKGYPLVYDNWYPNKVISIFKGKTQRYNQQPGYKTCSLRIYPVTWSHHRQKIYPWVDPEHVGRSTYRFFDKTVTIEVTGIAKKPDIMIVGDMKVGQNVQVECSVYHTCPSDPPTLKLSIPERGNQMTHTTWSMGLYKSSVTSTMTIENDLQIVECTVWHPGGQHASTSKTLNAKCSFSPLTISAPQNEFLEGYASKVACTASYTCPKHIPTLKWNYENVPASTESSKITNTMWKTVSTLTFTPSANDHWRSLTCYALFSGGGRQEKSITLRVKRNMVSRGWSFTSPGSITGMRGSCIIIPCRFTYSTAQPAGLRVIWYLYQSNGYPPVLDQTHSVISKFQGKTSLIGSVKEGNCSLKIEGLQMSHNQDRLYPWIDKNPITSFHTKDGLLYDKTTQLIVSDHAQKPQLNIGGIPRVGEKSKVSCSVRHTCPSAPPTLTLNGESGDSPPTETLVSDGIWERTIERTWTVKEEDQSVNCAVQYQGGQRATGELQLNVECPYEEITMVKPPGEVPEGVATNITCSVSYTCKKNKPTIEWNFENMHISSYTKPSMSNTYEAVSNLTFIGSMGDDGKLLTCTAKFLMGETSNRTVLHIKKYIKPAEERDPNENNTILAANVPFRITGLTHSCVVIPCSFCYERPLTRGIWSKESGDVIYHNSQSNVLDHFKGRTRLLGDLMEGNCSLEIDNIMPFDNGPFCFHAEKGHEKYIFNNSCVFIIMKATPGKPVMSPLPKDVSAGSVITVSCSVTHTCPSHPPEFSWSIPILSSEVTHIMRTQDIWEITSTITFMVAGGDGVKNLTCTAIFWRDKQQARTVQLNVMGSLMYQVRSSLPISIPVSALVLIAVILAAVLGVIVCRKRRCVNDSLTPPPRPEKRRSLWDRLSRRDLEHNKKPPRPPKGGIIWSQLSRRQRSSDDFRL